MEDYKIPKIHKDNLNISIETNTVFNFHIHTHSYYEMTLYEAFDGVVTVNDKAFKMDTPTVVLVAPSDFHRTEVKGRSSAKYIKIAFDAGLILQEPALDFSLVLSGIKNDDFIFRIFNEILKIKEQSSYLKQLVYTTVLSLTEKGEKILPSENAGGSRLAKKAVRIINERFSEDITLSSVAAELFVSPQHLSCVFKANIGINFSKFLSGVRLRRASKLLIETKESITHICEMSGYRNFSHFLRSFKNMFGCSPSDYRKNSNKPFES